MAEAMGENIIPLEKTEEIKLIKPDSLKNRISKDGIPEYNNELIDKLDDFYSILEMILEEEEELNIEESDKILSDFNNTIFNIKNSIKNNSKIESFSISQNFKNIFNKNNIDITKELLKIIENITLPKISYNTDIKGKKEIDTYRYINEILGNDFLNNLKINLPDFIEKISIKQLGADNKKEYLLINIFDSTGNIKGKVIGLNAYYIGRLREGKKIEEKKKDKMTNELQNTINILVKDIKSEKNEITKKISFEDIIKDIDLDNLKINGIYENEKISLLKKLHYYTNIDIKEIKEFKYIFYRKETSNEILFNLTIKLNNGENIKYYSSTPYSIDNSGKEKMLDINYKKLMYVNLLNEIN